MQQDTTTHPSPSRPFVADYSASDRLVDQEGPVLTTNCNPSRPSRTEEDSPLHRPQGFLGAADPSINRNLLRVDSALSQPLTGAESPTALIYSNYIQGVDHVLDGPLPSPPSGLLRPPNVDDDSYIPVPPSHTHNDGSTKAITQSSGKYKENGGEHRKQHPFSPKKTKAQRGKAVKVPQGTYDFSLYRPIVQPLIGVGGIQTGTTNEHGEMSMSSGNRGNGSKWRWYLQQGINNSCFGSLNKDPGPPVFVTVDNEWTAMLDMSNVDRGWYSVVICISFENERNRIGELSSAVFDVRQLDASNNPVYAGKSCRTVAGKEELSQIKSRMENRIRLHRQVEFNRRQIKPNHRQIEFNQSKSIKFTAILQAQGIKSVRVHYIELQQEGRNPDDLVLYGEGRPDEVILLGAGPEGDVREHLTIHAYNISATGTHAVTLCSSYPNNQPMIEVWSLLPGATIPPSTRTNSASRNEPNLRQLPLQYTSPLARGFLEDSTSNHPDLADICLKISADGRYVAIHSNERSDNGISCNIFTPKKNNNKGGNVSIEMSGHQSGSNRSMLTRMSLPQSLQGFFGYGTFHLADTTCAISRSHNDYRSPKVSCDEDIEWYITSDGISVSVYKITSDWVLVRNMTPGSEPHLRAALDAISGLRGRYFAWTGNEGILSIWDLVLGQQISYFQVEGGNADKRACLSRDGSLVAVSAKGAITVHEAATGIKLASYPHRLGDNNYFEIVLEKGHVMVLDQLLTKDAEEKMIERKIVAVGDMSVVRTYRVHRDYAVRYPVPANDQIFSYSQGSVVNIIRMDTKLISAPALNRFGDRFMTQPRIDQLSLATQSYISATGIVFDVAPSTSVIHGTWMTLITISYAGNVSQAPKGPKRSLTIPLGPSQFSYPAIFLSLTSRIAIVTGRYLQVWKLHGWSTADVKSGSQWDEVAELELLWALQPENKERYQDADICQREIYDALVDMELGEQFSIELKPASWLRRLKIISKDTAHRSNEVVTVPMSSKDTLSITLQERIKQGIHGVIDMYINGDEACRRATIRYLQTLVRPSDNCTVSCIVTLCQFWKHQEHIHFRQIMVDLLPTTEITWIPVSNPYEKDKDPLAILINTAVTQPAVIGVAKVIMGYCVNHANTSRNLAFLAPIFQTMHGMMEPFPEEVFECLSRIAYIPAKDRSYILDNHIVARPPRWRIQFWKPEENVLLLNEQEPIMQLHVTPTKPDSSNDSFTLPVFMASFDALWFYHDKKLDSEHEDRMKPERESQLKTTRKGQKTMVATTAMAIKMSRWTTFMCMLRLKLRPRNKTYVECHDFKDFEYFNNPAIAALVAYKWNTMGFSYWLVRFICQCFYYALIIMAAILQVYLPDPKAIFGAFVTIIVMAIVFIWLEILQAIQGWKKYKSSMYNFLDLLAFLVPMSASIDQIVVILQNDQQGNARLLSFSILIVSLHMLFELRINKSICKYVTIIQQAVAEIRIFFVIFAAGIVAFTIGILHLLHACPVGGCPPFDDGSTGTGDPKFPRHFFHALSSTYFFMGGRYDPISEEFNSDDWAFHIMMIIYFFFTVILMLNVLIALINKAFDKGDEAWRLAWVESRLRYIESAENMSYHIPGYRESHECFPTEIYFTATPQQVKAYEKRYRKKYNLDSSEQSSLAGAMSTAAALIAKARDRPALDISGAEGSWKTKTRDRMKEDVQGADNGNSRRNRNNDNSSNTENDKAILELRVMIQSLQEQSERLIDEMMELIRRR